MVSALAEAKRRWGKDARVKVRPSSRMPNTHDGQIGVCQGCWKRDCDLTAKTYLVGDMALGGLVFRVRGSGHSWEAAFADVDRLCPAVGDVAGGAQ